MPPANNADEDGIMDRLAKRLFASPDSPFTAFADQQRIDRLEQCHQFERILNSCRAANDRDRQIAANDETTEVDPSEIDPQLSRGGTRISRFFKWSPPDAENGRTNDTSDDGKMSVFGEAAASFQSDDDAAKQNRPSSQSQKKSKAAQRYSRDCSIETHELWACRALALGCGNYVGDLRRCWSEAEESRKQRRALAGDEGMTFKNGGENSCRKIQMGMANCVNRHAAELAERVRAAKKQ